MRRAFPEALFGDNGASASPILVCVRLVALHLPLRVWLGLCDLAFRTARALVHSNSKDNCLKETFDVQRHLCASWCEFVVRQVLGIVY